MFLGNSPHILTSWILKVQWIWKAPLDELSIKYLSAGASCVSLCDWELGWQRTFLELLLQRQWLQQDEPNQKALSVAWYILQITCTQISICSRVEKGTRVDLKGRPSDPWWQRWVMWNISPECWKWEGIPSQRRVHRHQVFSKQNLQRVRLCPLAC
jgi:hypothetical protein